MQAQASGTPQNEQHRALPESLAEVQEVIGLPATMKLVEAYGGTRVYVPKRLGVQHKLANLLGVEQARRLSHYFGGESLTVARAAQALRSERNKAIVRRFDAGETVRSLAQEHHMTERNIYTILSMTVL